jgi:hypothetical protein
MIKFIKCVWLTMVSPLGLVVFPAIRTPYIKTLRYDKR